MNRSRARAGKYRTALISATPLLGVVGYLIVEFAPIEAQAVALGACVGFLLAAMLAYAYGAYGAYALRQRRSPGAAGPP